MAKAGTGAGAGARAKVETGSRARGGGTLGANPHIYCCIHESALGTRIACEVQDKECMA